MRCCGHSCSWLVVVVVDVSRGDAPAVIGRQKGCVPEIPETGNSRDYREESGPQLRTTLHLPPSITEASPKYK